MNFKRIIVLYQIIRRKHLKILNYYFREMKIKNKMLLKRTKKSMYKLAAMNMNYLLKDLVEEEEALSKKMEKKSIIGVRQQIILIKYIFIKSEKSLFKYFITWYTQTLISKLNYIKQESNKVSNENDEVISSYYNKKEEYKSTIKDYLHLKNALCKECINNDFELDYKSIDQDEINEEVKNEELLVKESLQDLDSNNDNNNNSDIYNNQLNTISKKDYIKEKNNKEELVESLTDTLNKQKELYEQKIKKLQEQYDELLQIKAKAENKK